MPHRGLNYRFVGVIVVSISCLYFAFCDRGISFSIIASKQILISHFCIRAVTTKEKRKNSFLKNIACPFFQKEIYLIPGSLQPA